MVVRYKPLFAVCQPYLAIQQVVAGLFQFRGCFPWPSYAMFALEVFVPVIYDDDFSPASQTKHQKSKIEFMGRGDG
jgi:hypothetical protein